MKLRSESYPDRIRRIAQEVSQLRNLYQVDHSVEKLRMIANELEQVLKKTPLKKSLKLPTFIRADFLPTTLPASGRINTAVFPLLRGAGST